MPAGRVIIFKRVVRVSLIEKRDLRKDLEETELATGISGGKSIPVKGIGRTKTLRPQHAWGVPGAVRMTVQLE